VSGYKKSGEPSWGLVVFFIICFFPVGFYLLHKKLTADKINFSRCVKVNKVYGWTFIALGVFGIFSTATDTQEFSMKVQNIIFHIIFWGGIGYLFLSKAKRLIKKSELFQKYNSAIGMNYISDIDAIAKVVSVNYNKAVKDLQEMITYGYFGDGYINQAQRELVVPYRKVNYTRVEHVQIQPEAPIPQEAPKPTIKVVACSSCGANNTVTTGIVSECEFCGSPMA
jgi:hypothetical protein